jgi:hypothetical protein
MNDNQTTAGAGTAPAKHWMRNGMVMPKPQLSVTANQLTSLSAMIAYIAERTQQSEFRIERNLSDHFRIPNAKCLSHDDFDAAIRYLADILGA